MIKYQIQFKSSAAKELKSLPLNVKQRMSKVLEKLTENPRIFGVIKLQGDNKLYRVRVGNYRIIFQINDQLKLIKVTRIRHRQDVYKK